jgi:hypothetical protein
MVEMTAPTPKDILIATPYQWIKAESDAALFRLQAEAIERITSLLAELPPAPPVG